MASYTLEDGMLQFDGEPHALPYTVLDNETLYEIMSDHGYEGIQRDSDMQKFVLLSASPRPGAPPPPQQQLRALYSCDSSTCPMVTRKHLVEEVLAAISHRGFYSAAASTIFTVFYKFDKNVVRENIGFMDFTRERRRHHPKVKLPTRNKARTLLTWYRAQHTEVTIVLLCSGGLRMEMDLVDAVLRDESPTPIHFVLVDSVYAKEESSWLPAAFMREAASRAGGKPLRCTVFRSVDEHLARLDRRLDARATAVVAIDADSSACVRGWDDCRGGYKVMMGRDLPNARSSTGFRVLVRTDNHETEITAATDRAGERFVFWRR